MAARQHQLEDVLGHQFADPNILTEALTHRGSLGTSVKGKSGKSVLSTNERLEFLGDRVLGLVIADKLLHSYPDENEGALATRMAALVSAPALAKVAEEFDLASHIKLAPGQQAEATESTILADACEAVIGALFLDGGLEVASQFISARWEPLMRAEIIPPKDSKTALQEWAQSKRLPLPDYIVTSESGPAHAPVFTVSVQVEGSQTHQGQGRTKRLAEQAAAAALLKILPGSSL
jgi:ribonuclease III